MFKPIVLTVIGANRPGLVERLSAVISQHAGNWTESRMARLANQFTGMLLANVPEERIAALQENLAGLAGEGLSITLQDAVSGNAKTKPGIIFLELLGQDRPGIVREISHLLAGSQISIDTLETHVSSASGRERTCSRRAPRSLFPTMSMSMISMNCWRILAMS
jgi:glycine cleavage system regulatory protein